MKTRATLAITLLLAAGSALSAESAVTVRLGEQDTCGITGVTTITPAGSNAGGTIRFDLGKLPPKAEVTDARLRMWVDPGSRFGRAFGIDRWQNDGFEGFHVRQVGGGAEPLDTAYPFAFTGPACHEWVVTAAVKAWLANAASNKGLRTDFPLPPAGSEPAWQRPHLQVTYAGANPDRPAQPADLKAFYRSGQVFVTWKQIPYDGAFFDSTYRVYASDKPITAAGLAGARLLGEVNRNSQLNYRRSAYSHDGMGSYAGYQHYKGILGVEKTPEMTQRMYLDALEAKIPERFNFVIDDAWPAKVEGGKWLTDAKVLGNGLRELKGPELSDETGLFVWTVDKPGKVYLAVTSVIEGNENREDFAPANAPAEPVEVKVDTPAPVLQAAFHRMDAGYPHQKRQVLEYVFWGGAAERLAAEPSTPLFFRINPPGEFVGFGRGEPDWKAWIHVEPWWSHGGAEVVVDAIYIPPTRLAPFPPTRVPFTSGGWKQASQFYYGGRKGEVTGHTGSSWAFGRGNMYGYLDTMNTGRDPRGGVARPFFENRALRQLEMFYALYPKADRNMATPTGEGSSMMLAVHHPEAFGTCSAAQEEIWTSQRQVGQWRLVGMREWGTKTEEGFSPWDWNDPVWYSRQFPQRVWPFISICQSPNYARSDQTHWGDSGYPRFYLDMAAEKRGGAWWWCDIGDAPNGGFVPAPRNQAYPAFTGCNFCEAPRQEWREEPRGTLNGYLTWHNEHMPFKVPIDEKRKPIELALPLEMVDTPEAFEVSVRIGDRGRLLNGQSVPPTTARNGATDVTLWRLQQFKPAGGGRIVWANRKVVSGQVLQSGTAVVDDRGLITIPGVFVDRDPTGNRLTVTKAGSPAAVEKDRKVGELTYAEYAKACGDPVLFPPVDGEATFTIAEFGYVGGGNADGSISFKGGSFSSSYDTVVVVRKPGPYVLSVRAKGEFGGCWPLMTLGVGGKYGR
ncbi:MAG TPA: hypothetical protein VFJ30_03010, partial [Phycisphaerae bacterium]|nr:hypothetical protein [Phycisphaerae bacterium]